MNSGAPGAIAGYQFQLWFVALKAAEAFFNDNIEVRPEAKVIPAQFENDERLEYKETITSIDDCVLISRDLVTHYDLKYIAPKNAAWNLSDLKKEKVLERLYEQHRKNKNAALRFVSQSPCPLFQRAFKSVSNASNEKEIKHRLNKKEKENWDDIKKLLSTTDKQLFEFVKTVEYEFADVNWIKKEISNMFKGHVDKDGFVADTLYIYATECSMRRMKINQQSVLNYLKKENIHPKAHLDIIDINSSFLRASSSLISWKNTFGKLKSSQIQREEARQVVRWVKEDPLDSKDPIKVLVGSGGSGKTVICQQIYQSLIAEDIPVIGIKADQISAKSHVEFIQSLGLQDDLYKLLTSASLMKNRVVVIVDQIDALSLSLSADRSSITIMLNIIQQLLTVPHVRIIVSCREYDLHFDPMLQKYEDHNKVEVKELEREKVEYVLSSLGIDTKQISDKLLKLLQHPHHLDVFSEIYSSDLELNSILTLQDMYRKLWERKIAIKGEEYKLISVLDFISKKMSMDQRIVIGTELLLDQWPVGTRYLLSEGILIQAINNCQFFHQSFFDYTFARFFVNREESLAKYVLSRHQGLFVRSQLKQVLAYLRNINEAGYANEINRLFGVKNTRLHLKLAIVNQIGSEINLLNCEKEIIEKFVLVNPVLRRNFLDSIRSEAWFDWLVQKDLLISYLDSPDQDLAQGSGWMLITLVQYFPGKVLSYLNNLSISERNDKIISEVLYSLKDWKQAQALSLFERIALYLNKSEDFRISHIYINALNDQPEWVKDKLLEYILGKINSKATNEESTVERDFISSEMGHVLDKLKKLHPDLYYDLAYNVVPLLSLKTKIQWRESPFYLDGAFYGYDDFGSLYEHWKLLDGVIEYFRNIALNDCQKYEGLSADLLSSNSITLLTIVIEGWNQYPQNYIEQILQLLRRNDLLKEHSHYTKSFGIGVRKLILNVYTYLDESQKTRLDLQILEAEPDNEKSKENYSYHLRGLNQYRLLWAIPENERKGRYEVNRKFLELERKFGKYKEDSLKRHDHQMSGVGPPLPDSAYKYMTFTQWLETFKEYDDSTGWEANYHNPKDFHKGGLVEHYRAFGGCIKAEPDKYYPFVLTLINETISESYLSEALRAFTEIKYNSTKLKELILSIGIKFKKADLRISMVSAIRYLAGEKSVDRELLNILEEYALHDPDPEEEIWIRKVDGGKEFYGGDPLHHGINSVRGSAVEALVLIGQTEELSKDVITILHRLSEKDPVSVRCCAINHLAVLIRYDRKGIEKIFHNLTKDLHPQVVKYGLNCLSYLMDHNFSLYKKHLTVAMNLIEKFGYDSVQQNVGQILTLAYAIGLRGSKELLEKSCRISNDAKAGSVDFAIRHLVHQKRTVRSKAQQIYKRFINNKTEVVQSEYSKGFTQLEVRDFDSLFPLVLLYSKKKHIKEHSFDYLVEYLQKLVHSYPEKTVLILRNYFEKTIMNSNNLGYSDEPIQILIGAYDRLNKRNANVKELDNVMNLFDRMLTIPAMRYQAIGVLTKMDYL